MGEWIYRPNLQEDWMSLVFLINLLVILFLYKLEPGRLLELFNILNPRAYFGKYSHEKELNYYSYFNLACFVLIVSAVSLTCFSFSGVFGRSLLYSFEFYYLVLGLSVVLWVRKLLIQLVASQLKFGTYLFLPAYKSFTIATQASFFLLGVLFLWNYSSIPKLMTESLMVLLTLIWMVNQIGIFFSFFRSHTGELIYIILYLCTFKIAPWIWVYFIFIETKL